jgi:hypothetical protein
MNVEHRIRLRRMKHSTVCLQRKFQHLRCEKKSPSVSNAWGFTFSSNRNLMAGLLTFGSIYSPRLPGPDAKRTSGVIR